MIISNTYDCPYCGVEAITHSEPVKGYEHQGLFYPPRAPHCPCQVPLAEMVLKSSHASPAMSRWSCGGAPMTSAWSRAEGEK